MAIQTRQLGTLIDDKNGGIATLSIDYDDALLRLTAIHLINNTTFSVFCTAIRTNGTGQRYVINVPPGQRFDQTIAGGSQARLNVTIDAQGRVDGVDYQFGFGTA
jgi:hypothetical protein